MDIEFLITQPESKTLEFKRDLSSLKPILKTVVAFANTAGGVIIIGYSPDEGITGVEDVLQAEESLTNSISDAIIPSLHPDVDIKTIGGKNVLIVRVTHQRGPFYLKKEGLPNGVYMRFGSSSRQAGPDILADLNRHLENQSFDQLPCAALEIEGLDQTRISTFLEEINKPNKGSSTLRTLGILAPRDKKEAPSNGGIILFGREDVREHYFPDARISCARFKGLDKSQFIDRQDMEGSLLESIEPTLKFVSRNTRLGGIIRSLKREDIPEYPTIPLREVLLNAIIHGNYAIPGRIFVAIYDDRLEIQSPGMLPYGMTLDDFKSGTSHVRNRVVARVFRELGLIEEWGSGYNRITTYCNEFGYPIPEWQELGSAMRVIFRPHSSFQEERTPQETGQGKAIPSKLSPRQEAIIEILTREGEMKSDEILPRLKGAPAGRTLRDDLVILRKMGLVDTKGGGRATVWFSVKPQ